jgi:hypothetical protein
MRGYLITLAVLAVLAALMARQDVELIVLLGTMGIGLPFVFAATGLIYGLCAAPLAVLWRAGRQLRAVTSGQPGRRAYRRRHDYGVSVRGR